MYLIKNLRSKTKDKKKNLFVNTNNSPTVKIHDFSKLIFILIYYIQLCN